MRTSDPSTTSDGAARIATVLTSVFGLLWFFVPAGALVLGRGTGVVSGLAMLQGTTNRPLVRSHAEARAR